MAVFQNFCFLVFIFSIEITVVQGTLPYVTKQKCTDSNGQTQTISAIKWNTDLRNWINPVSNSSKTEVTKEITLNKCIATCQSRQDCILLTYYGKQYNTEPHDCNLFTLKTLLILNETDICGGTLFHYHRGSVVVKVRSTVHVGHGQSSFCYKGILDDLYPCRSAVLPRSAPWPSGNYSELPGTN